jgi:hypothetical protein
VSKDLFRGIGIVIDDEIGLTGANINRIIKHFEGKQIPLVKYSSLPDIKIIDNLQAISFLVLDWNLVNFELGVQIPDELINENNASNISFLRALIEKCFCPIFIFTNENITEIKRILRESNLYQSNKQNRIFIRQKSVMVQGRSLFTEINSWITKIPSVYVLKKWQDEYNNAVNTFFNNFQKFSPNWPLIMWKCFKDDGANASLELGNLLTRNMYARMMPFVFSDEILDHQPRKVGKQELRMILEGERFLTKLHPDDIGTGDVFKETVEGGKVKYLVNIRAQCDLLRKSNPDLYCLKGRIIDESKINKKGGYQIIEGQFSEKITNAIVGFVDGCIIEFSFYDLEKILWKKIKNNRIGRILSPYINRIQQKYSSYLERQGSPRIPNDAIKPSKTP